MRFGRLIGVALGVAVAVGSVAPARAADDVVTVFAAASTTRAVTEIADAFKARGFGEVRTSFNNSAALAKQIEQGAPATIFISADEKWMDYVAERRLIEAPGPINLLGNRLALLAPVSSPLQVRIEPGFPLARLLGDGRLAVGNPEFVPVGIYAKGALETLGIWTDVQGRLIPTTSALETVTFVERGEAPLGIGFASDVVGSSRARVVALFPEASHAPIVYPVAMVKGNATPRTKVFYDFLRSDEAAAIFAKYGFKVLR